MFPFPNQRLRLPFFRNRQISRRLRLSVAVLVLALTWSFKQYLLFLMRHDISGFVIEYENFNNDLPNTVRSISPLVSRIAIFNHNILYPPFSAETMKNLTEEISRFDLVEGKKSLKYTHHLFYLYQFFKSSRYMLIFPDAIRPAKLIGAIKVEEELQKRINEMNYKNIDAVVYPVWEVAFENNSPQLHAESRCRNFYFNTKQWTLDFSSEPQEKPKKTTCEYLNRGGFVLLIRRRAFFRFHNPLLRPFMHSFFLQAQLFGLSVTFTNKKVFIRTKKLFNDTASQNKRNTLEYERRKNLYKELGIKRVLPFHRPEEWFGCDREKPRCFQTVYNNTPDYLYVNRWLPPCCRRNLEITGRYVFQLLDTLMVRFWLEGGSLLGAVRNGNIIPWDFDIDIGVYKEDLVLLGESISDLLTSPPGSYVEDGAGYIWEKAIEGDFLRVHYSKINRIHVDIFPFYSLNGIMTKDTWFKDHPQDREFPEIFLKPMSSIDFIGARVPIPNNPSTFLELKFGRGVVDNPKMPGNFNIEDFD